MAKRKPLIVIEHLEEELSPWLLLEYRHASLIVGRENIVFTNVPKEYHSILNKYAVKVYEESILNLFDHNKILILDPVATEQISSNDIDRVDYVVVGGILGDHPPRKRTFKYLSSKAPKALKRNIGEGQYSIDGAVYVITKFIETRDLESIKYIDGLTISHEEGGVVREIHLPFRYPVVDGEPLLAPGLKEYLIYGRIPSEILSELKDP